MAGRKPAEEPKRSPNYYTNQYIEQNQQVIRIKVNRKTEPEMLEWIQQHGNIQGYIKRLILEDMKRESGKGGEMDG